MFDYPVILEQASEGGFVVTFPDVPEAITQGEDEEEALLRAQDALETALSMYVESGRDLPKPTEAQGRPTVRPGTLTCAKLALYQTMRSQGVRKAELARRLHWHMPQVDRLLDLDHASRLDQIEQALAVLGKRLTVEIDEYIPV
jgi:antitoxin HicB